MICQSCAMPMKKEDDFGTNIDGGKNEEYCCFCFKEGKFLDEGISIEDKIDQLVEMGKSKLEMTEEHARTMAEKIIPTLKRWKK